AVLEQRLHRRWEQHIGQTKVVQCTPGGQGLAGEEQLQTFIEEAGGGDGLQQLRRLADGSSGSRVDAEVEFGGQADRAQSAYRIFAVALDGIADHAQGAGADILEAVHEVVDGEIFDGVVERIDGKVAANGV